MFSKILHANDGAEHAFHALAMALAMSLSNRTAGALPDPGREMTHVAYWRQTRRIRVTGA